MKITTNLRKGDYNAKILELYANKEYKGCAIFHKDTSKTALHGTYHTPEFRYLMPDGSRPNGIPVLVGQTPDELSKPEVAEMYLKHYNLI